MVASGWRTSEASQEKFCEVYNFAPTTYSTWVGGRVPGDVNNIRLLAECPYIGKKVYRVLGLAPEVDDHQLRAWIDEWPHMTHEERQEAMEILRRSQRRRSEGGTLSTITP